MKSGIELITEERQEQLTKHGYSVDMDVKFNKENELVHAIMMLISNIGFNRSGIRMPDEALDDLRPESWSREICLKLVNKPELEQLQIIGAFSAAEIDRINAISESKIEDNGSE